MLKRYIRLLIFTQILNVLDFHSQGQRIESSSHCCYTAVFHIRCLAGVYLYPDVKGCQAVLSSDSCPSVSRNADYAHRQDIKGCQAEQRTVYVPSTLATFWLRHIDPSKRASDKLVRLF